MPQLDISTYLPQLFWLLVTFLVFVYVCANYFIPIIGKRVNDRKFAINKKTEEAEMNKYKASEVLESTNRDYNETLLLLDNEKREKKNELFRDFSAKKESVRETAKARLKKGLAEVSTEISEAEKSLNGEVAELVKMLEDKIVKL